MQSFGCIPFSYVMFCKAQKNLCIFLPFFGLTAKKSNFIILYFGTLLFFPRFFKLLTVFEAAAEVEILDIYLQTLYYLLKNTT